MSSDCPSCSSYYFSGDGFIASLIIVAVLFFVFCCYCCMSGSCHNRQEAILQPIRQMTVDGGAEEEAPVRTPISQPAAKRGLSPSVIATMPTFIYKKKKSDRNNNDSGVDCVICLTSVEGKMARLLPNCKHVFHVKCIDKWLSLKSTCPICKSEAKPKAHEKKCKPKLLAAAAPILPLSEPSLNAVERPPTSSFWRTSDRRLQVKDAVRRDLEWQ